MSSTLFNLRMDLRGLLGRHPRPFQTLWPLLRPAHRDLLVSRATEVVIEGFPRSANTFAVVAFLMAQGRPVRIAHHLHVPAQVLLGVRFGLPTLVLVREPAQAVASLLVRHPRIPREKALATYVAFHERILSARQGFIAVSFEEATKNLGAVTERLNARFGTSFTPFQTNEDNVRAVFERIEEINRQGGNLREREIARPSRERLAPSARIVEEMQRGECASLLAQARTLHGEILGRSSAGRAP